MTSADQTDGSLMSDIDRSYRLVSGLADRRYYKIFYCHLHPFPILVLGQNPGGETDGNDLVASETFFENWEHDFACFRHCQAYPLAGAMCNLLAAALSTRSVDVVRQVPVSNVSFRRSRNTKSLNISLEAAAKEAQPFVRKILMVVDPRCILLVSNKAYDLFVTYHCQRGSVTLYDGPKIYTPNGKNPARIFLRGKALVSALGREVPLIMTGHPSKYSTRAEWASVIQAVQSEFQRLALSPIERCTNLRSLPPISAYGATL